MGFYGKPYCDCTLCSLIDALLYILQSANDPLLAGFMVMVSLQLFLFTFFVNIAMTIGFNASYWNSASFL